MADTGREYEGMADCLRKILKRQGVSGLFVGIGPPLVAISPAFAVYFWGFDVGKRLYALGWGGGGGELPLSGIVFAGAFSALPGAAVLLPFDLVKVKLQVELTRTDKRFTTAWGCAKQVYQQDGLVRGLYKGTGAMLIREVPSTMAYYTTYELIKRRLVHSSSSSSGGERPPSAAVILTAGGFAGMANWLVAVPPDVIKTRYQTAPRGAFPGGLVQVARELVANEGFGALFKGLAPALIRAFPSNAACFLGMELSKRLLDRYI
ncbi:hypothetical protein BASA81_001392 [Batrachochytrium salamandrivorans]|nr:hypothetical protein BASA81_001392 [Batrachochytrium salamandrivorans]